VKVIVTGGAGFIGSHIVDYLIENNAEVLIIDNFYHSREKNVNKRAKLYRYDIRDSIVKDLIVNEKPDVIIHEAAQISVSNSVKNPKEDASINIIGTLNLLQGAVKGNVKKIIYPASAAIFGEPMYLPIDEAHPLNMKSPYGVSKHVVEDYLRIYNEMHNINYVSLRYSNVFGPGQDSSGEGGVVAIFCEKLLRGERPEIYGDGNQLRDFVYVKDVARANILALNDKVTGIYNVCTNTKVSVNYLYSAIENILKTGIKPIYQGKRAGDILNSYMSYDKIYNELDWKPEYALEAGLIETLKYYENEISIEDASRLII
jgi:UDP-glucose 4-epimerase